MDLHLFKKVKASDYERAITALFAEGVQRAALIALYAFNLEVAKIASVTTEPMLGMIRFQWWRESLEQIYQGQPRRHEVIDELALAIKKYNLSKELFLKIIDVREKDLDQYPLGTLADFKNYADETSANLLLLAAEILGCEISEFSSGKKTRTYVFLTALGNAWAMVGLIRSLKYQLANNRCYLPKQLMNQYGINIDSSWKNEGKLAEIVNIILVEAEIEYKKAKEILEQFDKQTRKKLNPLSLLLVFLDSYIKRIKKANGMVLSYEIEQPKLPILLKVILSSNFCL